MVNKNIQKLYYVSSIVNNFNYKGDKYDNVRIVWYKVDGNEIPHVPFIKAIKGYIEDKRKVALQEKDFMYAEVAVCELFTKKESSLVVDYILKQHGNVTEDIKLDVVKLPIKSKTMPFSAIGCGQGDGDYWLSGEDEYALPFKVWGHYYIYDGNCRRKDGKELNIDDEIQYIGYEKGEIFTNEYNKKKIEG